MRKGGGGSSWALQSHVPCCPFWGERELREETRPRVGSWVQGEAQARAGTAGWHRIRGAPGARLPGSPQARFQQAWPKKRKRPGQGRASLWLLAKPGPGDREEVSLSRCGGSDSFLAPRLRDTAKPRNYPKAANWAGPVQEKTAPPHPGHSPPSSHRHPQERTDHTQNSGFPG